MSHSPVKAYGVEKCRKPFHDQKDKNSQNCKESHDRQQQQDPIGGVHTQAHTHQHGPQHIGQLCKRSH